MTNLVLTFAKASGGKKTIVIPNAKEIQNPEEVKQLMQHIIDRNIIYAKTDPIVSIASAKIESITYSNISL